MGAKITENLKPHNYNGNSLLLTGWLKSGVYHLKYLNNWVREPKIIPLHIMIKCVSKDGIDTYPLILEDHWLEENNCYIFEVLEDRSLKNRKDHNYRINKVLYNTTKKIRYKV